MSKRNIDVRVGPDITKHVRHNKPLLAVLVFGFIVVDAAKWHLLHRIFGEPAGGIIAAILIVTAIVQGAWRLTR
jgi:hypothetical protein